MLYLIESIIIQHGRLDKILQLRHALNRRKTYRLEEDLTGSMRLVLRDAMVVGSTAKQIKAVLARWLYYDEATVVRCSNHTAEQVRVVSACKLGIARTALFCMKTR